MFGLRNLFSKFSDFLCLTFLCKASENFYQHFKKMFKLYISKVISIFLPWK